ncbi:class I SAM-dependent methyltransferase [Nocardiopsis composta]
MEHVDDGGYGRMFADHYDEVMPKDSSADGVAAVLAELSRGREPCLELGVGTGRIALPLARRVGSVVGVDFSREMLALLEHDVQATGADVRPVLSDMRGYTDGAVYPLVYCVTGVLSGLTGRSEQRDAVLSWAECVEPGGRLVIEVQTPEAIALLHAGKASDTVFQAHPEGGTGVLVSRVLDTERSLWHVSSAYFGTDRTKITRETCRLVAPAELDSHATEAGLRLHARFGDWEKGPLTVGSGTYISVYERPAKA